MIRYCLPLLIVLSLGCAPPSQQSRRHSYIGDPSDPNGTILRITPDERERIGLQKKTWPGVVHSDVYPRLNSLKASIEAFLEMLRKKNGNDPEAFRYLFGLYFAGTVRVEVATRAQSNTENAGRRVLSRLSASEFFTQHVFRGSAGFVGFATKTGLDQLAADPDVIGICIDTQPIPADREWFSQYPTPGTANGTSTSVFMAPVRKVEPDVIRALAVTERVNVNISLSPDSLPSDGGAASERWKRLEAREQAERMLSDRVLSTVNADDLWVYNSENCILWGGITRAGAEKISRHPEVQIIELPKAIRVGK